MLVRILTVACVVSAAHARAQDGGPAPDVAAVQDIADLSLDALLDTPIEVASRRKESSRSAPALLTVLSREEILASGARDLADVLMLVPGFTLHLDVQSAIGIGFRGLWAHEGKVLVMVDGVEVTELLYATNQLGMHWLTDTLERVEIIRGPGSAVYGGTAELAVINLVTRGAAELEGFEVQGRYGQMASTFSDRTLSLGVGKTLLKGDLGLSLTGYFGEGNRSGREYRTQGGDTFSLAQQRASASDPGQANLAVRWKDFTLRVLVDDYRGKSIDGLGTLATRRTEAGEDVVEPGRIVYRTLAADLRGQVRLRDNLTLLPRVHLRWQQPWRVGDPSSSLFFNKAVARALASLAVNWGITDAVDLLGGVDFTLDHGYVVRPDLAGTGLQTDFATLNPNDPSQAGIWNLAAYAQLQWATSLADVTLGGRFEYNSRAGPSFVPRIAVTKSFERLNVKLLYSGAFRAPSIENLSLGEGLKPERAGVGEAELGYQLNEWAYAAVSAFVMDVTQPIVYGVDPQTQVEAYRNAGTMGSRGLEFEARLKGTPGFLRATYSLAEPSPGSDVASFQIEASRTQPLAFPTHKITAWGRLKLPVGFSLNGSAIVLGSRFAIVGAPDVPAVVRLPWTAVLGLNAGWDCPQEWVLRGLSVTLGVNNLLNHDVPFVQPYDGGGAPLPGRERDFFVRVGYSRKLGE